MRRSKVTLITSEYAKAAMLENIEQNLIELMADYLDNESLQIDQAIALVKDPVPREESELHIRMAKAAFLEYKKTIVEANTVLPSVRLSMEEILRDAVRRQSTYQVQFEDYDLHTWTAPCQLTENRMEKLLDDGSIRKVRLELEM